MKTVRTALISLGLVAALAGCTFSGHANLTAPSKSIAATAAKALQKEVGTAKPPKLDCGSGQTDLVKGKKLHCTLTDPTNGSKYATIVTLTKVNGLKYSIDVQVAKTPN